MPAPTAAAMSAKARGVPPSAFTRARPVASSARNGANDPTAVRPTAWIVPLRVATAAKVMKPPGRISASVAGTATSSATSSTRRGSNRSTRGPAIAAPTRPATLMPSTSSAIRPAPARKS